MSARRCLACSGTFCQLLQEPKGSEPFAPREELSQLIYLGSWIRYSLMRSYKGTALVWEEEFGWKREVKTVHSNNSGTVREGFFLGAVAALLEGVNTFEEVRLTHVCPGRFICVYWTSICFLLCVYQSIIIIITQWFGLEGTVGIICFQPPRVGRDTFHYPVFLRAPSRLPWTLPGVRHPQLLWASCARVSPPSQYRIHS